MESVGIDMIDLEKIFSGHPALASLSVNDRSFLGRVLCTPEVLYQDRVRAVGFEGLGRVLDAGCGFGQWTVPLSRFNGRVDAIDISSTRMQLARVLCVVRGAENVHFCEASTEAVPFAEATFDGVFSFSVLYLTDWRRSLAELYRCLAPGGVMYINTNGFGWYLLNLLEERNSCEGYSSKSMALESLENSIRYYAGRGTAHGASIVMPSEIVISFLMDLGASVVAVGPDGSISLSEKHKSTPFFRASEYGAENVWELVCRKS
jgi:SAM-dependent methyltransferase